MEFNYRNVEDEDLRSVITRFFAHSLKYLNLNHLTKMTDKTCSEIIRSCKKLEALELYWSTQLTDA